jgi:V/A-type H+-transporting ATPase subunit E
MGGLDKIIGHISHDAENEVKSVLDAAKAQAESIVNDAKEKTAEECDRINKKAATEVQSILDRGRSSAELKTKQILLTGRQELISETINMVRDRLNSLSDEEYAEFITGLFAKHVPNKDAVLKLNAADMKRIPKEVLDGFVKKAEEAGAKLTVSGEAAGIKNGFVLDFGEIEENCTFDALIDQNIEELQDKVKSLLFA